MLSPLYGVTRPGLHVFQKNPCFCAKRKPPHPEVRRFETLGQAGSLVEGDPDQVSKVSTFETNGVLALDAISGENAE